MSASKPKISNLCFCFTRVVHMYAAFLSGPGLETHVATSRLVVSVLEGVVAHLSIVHNDGSGGFMS